MSFEGFEKVNREAGLEQYRKDYPNGWGVSVIRGTLPSWFGFTYGAEDGLYELAVLKDGELHYNNPVADGDVRGYLTPEQVLELAAEVEAYDR